MRVAVTGASGYLGRRLVRELAASSAVESVLAIDLAPPGQRLAGVSYHTASVLEPLAGLLREHGVDTLLHLVHLMQPGHDRQAARAVNVGGVERVLEACAAAGIKTFLYSGSTTAYWPRPDNPPLLTEEQPLRPKRGFQYSWDKAAAERLIVAWAKAHPQVRVIRFRAPVVLGPAVDNYIGRILRKPLVVRVAGADPPMQCLHEDDVGRSILALLERAPTGA